MDQKETNTISTTWIENLAMDELNMEESGVVFFNEHLNPNEYLEESSVNLVDEIRELFEIYVTKFNQFRGNQGSIKIFKISNTVNDFMLFRNSLKLVVARRSPDVISIGFLSNTGGLYSARLNQDLPATAEAHELRAQLGAFNDIAWTFNGERINLDSMVKHYLTEFIKHSAR